MNASLAIAPVRLQRTQGEGRIGFIAREGRTALATLHQSGAAKIRLPRVHGRDEVQAVLINTSGGLAGGDHLVWRVEAEDNVNAVVTTQACERAYRTLGDAARVEVSLQVGAGAWLDWLPQETILYDNSALERRLDAEVAPDGTLLVVEAVLLGRLAHGETVRAARFHDRWRIRRGGRLIFAEETRLEAPVDQIARHAATLGGGAAFATVIFITQDAEARLASVRASIGASGAIFSGASAFEGKLVCRMVAQDGLRLRAGLIPVLHALRTGLDLPRVWMT